MKKLIMLVTACVMLILSSIPFSYADSVQAAMEQPVPVYEIVNNQIHIVYYYVIQSSNVYYLVCIDAMYPAGTQFVLTGNTANSYWRSDKRPNSGNIYTIGLTTGNLTTTTPFNPFENPNANNGLPAPNYFNVVNNTENNGFFPTGANVSLDQQGTARYDITWSAPVPVVHTYKSFCSRPVADQLNRYMILAGQETQYLYAIRYFMAESTSVSETIPLEYQTTDMIVPQLDVNNNGMQLRLAVAEDMAQLIGANTLVVEYDIQITIYNLYDGQYVASYVYTDFAVADSVIDFAVLYPDIADIDSVDFYGIHYQNTSTRYNFNLLACTWALDPDFLQWQNNVITYLDLIYQNLSQSGEEVTIAQDPSAYDEMQSAADDLKVTDPNGQEVDPAAQVEVAFSEAASGIGSIGGGISSVNGMMTDLFQVNPIVLVPLVVALALGLIVTILGKDKSD